jgi:hypothetical protein
MYYANFFPFYHVIQCSNLCDNVLFFLYDHTIVRQLYRYLFAKHFFVVHKNEQYKLTDLALQVATALMKHAQDKAFDENPPVPDNIAALAKEAEDEMKLDAEVMKTGGFSTSTCYILHHSKSQMFKHAHVCFKMCYSLHKRRKTASSKHLST